MTAPRAEDLEQHKRAVDELLAQRAETLSFGEVDDEVQGLLDEIDAAVATAVRKLAHLYNVRMTDDEGAGGQAPTVYQVAWDDGSWYSCTLMKPAYDAKARTLSVTARILGYNIDEVASMDRIRQWQPPAAVPVAPGVQCHVVHPETGAFVPATVDRTTLKGSVAVTVQSGGTTSAFELPPTHVHTGRFYPTLRKKVENMSAEERRKFEEDERRKKRERMEAKRDAKAQRLEAAAGEWQDLLQQVGRPQPAAKAAAGPPLPMPTRAPPRAPPKQR